MLRFALGFVSFHDIFYRDGDWLPVRREFAMRHSPARNSRYRRICQVLYREGVGESRWRVLCDCSVEKVVEGKKLKTMPVSFIEARLIALFSNSDIGIRVHCMSDNDLASFR
jgi:hypothetical protein